MRLTKSIRLQLKKQMTKLASLMGSPSAFLVAVLIVILWAGTGPLFNYSENWQLYINTLTTIATFLVAFSIQFTQHKDTKEIKAKINALMRQNEELSEQLDSIEKEIADDDDEE